MQTWIELITFAEILRVQGNFSFSIGEKIFPDGGKSTFSRYIYNKVIET